MSDVWDFDHPEPLSPGDYARGRIPGRLSTSRRFTINRASSSDYGQPARFTYEVFDDDGSAREVTLDGETYEVRNSTGTRVLLKVLVSREAGNVMDVWLQRVPASGDPTNLLHLRRAEARQFFSALEAIKLVDPTQPAEGSHVDHQLIADLLNNPESAAALYGRQPDQVRLLIANDDDAKDVIALAGRRKALDEFRQLLDDDAYFDSEATAAGGPEHVWQRFFEANPWTLGLGLGSQLFTSWSDAKLEQVVVGNSIQGAGKRTDALLRTAGVIRSMVFAEIKHHRAELLKGTEYRPAIWAPSNELAGGLAQVQGTVQRAVASIGERIQQRDAKGFELPGDLTYLLRPRSFLIVGRLSEFTDDAGSHNPDKIKSFELFRRHLHEPEVVTFDELLARATWIVESDS